MQVSIKAEPKVLQEFKELKKAAKFSQAELDLLTIWTRLVKKYGSLILQKIIEVAELVEDSAEERRASQREPQKNNLFSDHLLDREWAGHRASSLSYEARIIYKTHTDDSVEIVQITRITPDHNYKIK